GDRTFGKTGRYPYTYDLAGEWIRFTGLPFVFAVWAANKPIPETFLQAFNAALKFGLDHRKEVISELPHFDDFDMEEYLTNQIDFNFDAIKKEALQKFLGMRK